MTYSRPSTNTVDAFADPGLPGQIDVKGTSRAEVSRSGRLFDNRDPNQLIRNADAKNAVLSNFVNTVTKQAPRLIKGALQDQANQQIGELLASQNPDDLMRSTTAGPQRDAIRALNPFARDRLEQWQGVYGASQYQEIYTAETEKNKAILTSPNTPPDKKAQIRSDIKSTSMELSGLSSIAPRVLGAVGPELAAFEGQVAGRNYQDTLTNQRNEDFIVLENGVISGITGYLLREQEDMSGLTSWLTNQVASQNEMFTPNEFADATYSGLQTQVQQLIAEGNTDQAVALTNGALALAKTDVKTPSGTSFFDLKDSQGKSLLYKLSILSRTALATDTAASGLRIAKVTGNFALDYKAAKTAEEKDAAYQTQLGMISGMKPEDRADAIAAAGRVMADLDRPTQLQIQNSAQAMLDITSRGLDKDTSQAKLMKLFNNEAITATQFSQRMAEVANGNPDAAIYEGIKLGGTAADAEMQINIMSLIDAGDVDPSGVGTSALEGLSDADKKTVIENDLRKRVTTALEKKAKEARGNGNPWTSQMYVDNYREELAIQAQQMSEKLSKGLLGGTTRLEKINKEYLELANNVKSGPLTIESFSPETIKRFEQNNDGKPTVNGLLGEMSRQLEGLKDDKGKPIYPDATKKMKELARQSRVEQDEYGFWDKFNPLNYLLGIPQLKELETFQNVDRTPEQQVDEKEEKVEKTRAIDEKDPERGFQKVLMQGLGALGNVITLPAQAGTLEREPGVLNANNSPQFAKVMARQIPLGIKTQALPQLSAATPVRRAPIAISSRNHPFFVAIGIAEGTRTPSGANTKAYYGHTDPGDGNLNRGTVSGGRNGGSPQQVDRQWMGTLTSVSATMAPVLQRLGLPPNSQGWNRVMFNILDLRVQAPAAVQTFISKLPQVMSQGLTVEAIAKARADSFFNPQTGRLEASGFSNNYSRLFADQRSRAGVYDYKRRF